MGIGQLSDGTMIITGECFCGQVKFQVDGKLRDIRSCHCSRCRKAFNAQASAVGFVNPDDFQWVSGENLLSSYVGEHGYGLQFCKICGSTTNTVFKDEVLTVSLGCLNGDPEIELGMHIFVDSKASWETIPEGVPQYAEWPADEQ
jgi:hypothetical protein